ncbi:FAD-dependent oxidoreductase [Desulfopila aestuarii]|uniref:Succinate dehydrogenase/fumarate reductase, flavoprotein subunit n=1 Tax=Desulfopila aestuarii DSM 18488 TaxID=1121416 RepID=A0A1M7XYD0_9BACT|nr:FAD-dependent oxidoreductase [Desulfopila aestuarii]SHO44018.1 Succinate dehydrogenase/fumarate reductase, flavoprotein subunit [Desulfopila aestuarii DSM 18488]
MDIKGKEVIDIARRKFLKTSAVAALGVASAGCAASTGLVGGDASQGEGKQQQSSACEGQYAFETAPEPIPASKITETVTTDVVVVGAGVSGVIAALSAQEAGARTIVLQKGPVVMCHGTTFGAIDSKLQLEKKCHVDKMGAINEFQYQSLNKPKYQLLKKWADHSGETFDWINKITTEQGNPGKFLDKAGSPTGNTGGKSWFNAYSTGHTWKGGMMKVINQVARKAIQKGVEFRFYTPAVQLVRKENGRVTGVIAKSEKTGQYKQFNARKGVILCTGDYSNNPDMVAKYCPSAVGLQNYYQPRYNTGDGHVMGLWIGAGIEQGPHTKMAHVHSSLDTGKGDAPSKGAPWLSVNHKGERFCNEDMPFFLMANQTGGDQGDGYYYHILDADWEDNLKQFPPRIQMVGRPGEFEQALKAGTIIQADTIEELASRLGLPPSNLKETVARYNELVKKGMDEDFGKDAIDLTFIKKAPFYGIPRLACVSVVLGGLNINSNMQVLDTEGEVIPGLYAAGNASGDFFGGANDYPFPIIAISVGRAGTFGRLAGKHAAAA